LSYWCPGLCPELYLEWHQASRRGCPGLGTGLGVTGYHHRSREIGWIGIGRSVGAMNSIIAFDSKQL